MSYLRPRVNGYRNSYGQVTLSISGPKYSVGGQVLRGELVTAQLSDTWIQVFNERLKLNLNLNDGYYVRRSNIYQAPAPMDGNGWECELDEELGVFVGKFRRKRRKHAVVLCMRNRWSEREQATAPSTPASVSSSWSMASQESPEPPPLTPEVEMEIGAVSMVMANVKTERRMERTESFSSLRIEGIESVEGGGGGREGPSTIRSATAVGLDVSVNEGTGEVDGGRDVEEDQGRETWGWDDDLESLATGVGRQLSVLNEKGIPVEEVRAKVEQQVRNCTNKLILGVIDDVLKQQDKPSWEGMAQKMPSVCLFLDKIVNKNN